MTDSLPNRSALPAAELWRQVEMALAAVRPILLRDGGDARLVDITPSGVVRIALEGNCGTCATALVTMKMGIERAIRERVPQVTAVEEAPRGRPEGTYGTYVPGED